MAHEMPQVPGVKHSFVSAGGMNFHVAESGEGEPVLLLHGFPQHWYAWRLVIPKLAQRHRVIALDLRGFGWTDIAWEGFEKENMADDVARVIEALELGRVRVVGHDWGAWIGYLLALRRPELVERLVALNAPPPWFAPRPGNMSLRRMRFLLPIAGPLGARRFRRPSFVARRVRRLAVHRENLDKEVLRLYGRDLRASTRARAATMFVRTFLRRELPAVLRGRYRGQRLTVPTLAMIGAQDPLLRPRIFNGIEANADDLRVEKVKRSGHLLPEEFPDLVADSALAFFDGAPEPVAAGQAT